jgi:hypothetical protein
MPCGSLFKNWREPLIPQADSPMLATRPETAVPDDAAVLSYRGDTPPS